MDVNKFVSITRLVSAPTIKLSIMILLPHWSFSHNTCNIQLVRGPFKYKPDIFPQTQRFPRKTESLYW